MNSRKLLTMVLSATLITGAAVSSMPLYHAETVGSTQTDTGQKTTSDVDMPYTQNISNVLSEQMELKLQREDCDSNFDSMRSTANEQIADMEEISSHLNTQYEKYSDYGKLKKAKHRMDKQLGSAKSLLMSTNGAYTTNEYKYNIELVPDEETVNDVNSSFEEISKLYYDAQKNDMTVRKYRGFYDIGDEREDIVKTAMGAIGKISYQWGAKSTSEEMPSQLDCSGFVQWVYRAVQGKTDETLASTASIGSTYEQIQKDELKPGDIGMKNPEGTCFKDASGTVFYSEAAAKASNDEFNEKIKKAIELQKTDYEDAVKKENKSFKKDLKEIKEGKWKGMTEKLKSQESDDHETLKSGNEKADPDIKTDESSLDKTQAKTLKKVKVEEKPDKTDKKKKKVKKQEIKQKKTTDSEKKISKKEKTTEDIELRTEIHEHTLRDLKRQKKKSINKLKKEFIDDNTITKQIGHVGIYAGKDKDGNDTWIHCTGGSIDNVVLTTENEYDGFQYFYSPLENTRKNVSAGNFLDGTKVIKLPELEGYNGGKTYEPYTTITSVNSWQYKLQQKAYTNEDGFRMINGRYMIATGSGVSHDIGRYIDIVLENGTVIPCVIGDAKDDAHTDQEFHIMTKKSHCVSEFLVDESVMNPDLLLSGNMSNYREEWNSKVVKFILYDKNFIIAG
ncbi:MAG: NlpC/P60 family protein [Roseburia faecis]